MSDSTTNVFFDMFCGMILTLAVIFVFMLAIGVVAFIIAYGVRAIDRWWRKRK